MAERLRVDITALENAAGRLGRLRTEFAEAGQIADVGISVAGTKGLADALDEFADNWKVHRGKLIENLDTVVSMATDSAATYREVDECLAAELVEAGGE